LVESLVGEAFKVIYFLCGQPGKKEERREKKEEVCRNSSLSNIVGEKLRLETYPENRKSSPECFARTTRKQTKNHPKKQKINS
jgi:hypothetical protein